VILLFPIVGLQVSKWVIGLVGSLMPVDMNILLWGEFWLIVS